MVTLADYERWKAKQQQNNVGAANVVLGAVDGNPDEIAGDLNLANEFGKVTGNPVPPASMVKGYRPIFQQAIEREKNTTILMSSPTLTRWLRNPENAAVARDDLENLAWWEYAAIVPRGIASAIPAFNQGAWGTAAAIAAIPGENPVSRFFMGQAKVSEELAKSVAGPAGGWAGQQFQGAARSIGMMLPGIAASALSAGAATPAVMAAYLAPGAIAQGGQSAQKGMEKGIGAARSVLYGATDAAAEVLLGRLPVGRLLGDVAQGAGFGRILMNQLATEVPSEVATTIFQNLNEWVTLNKDKPLGVFLAEQPEAIRDTVAQTVLSVLGMSGAGAGLSRMARVQQDMARARSAEDRQALFQELAGQAVNSKLRARMPDKFRQFVEAATANGPVANLYVPADQFVEYFQGIGVDPHALVDELDGVTRDDLDAALAGGGDLQIPTATYAAKIAGSEHDAFLMENMRFDPDQFTAREAAEFNAHAQEALNEAWEVAEELRQQQDELRSFEQEIFDTMVSRLRAAGRSTDVATTEAMLYPAFYRVMAERSGMTVDEFMQRYPLPQVSGDLPTGMQFRNVNELDRTLAEARARRAASPRRQSLLEFIDGYGGINDPGGELRARDAEVVKRGRGKKTLKLSRGRAAAIGDMFGGGGGKRFGLDDVAQAAIEHGYMADDPVVLEYKAALERGDQVPDIGRALMDAIDRELRGEPQYSADDQIDESAAEIEAMLDGVEEYLAGLDVSLDDDDATIKAAIEADQAKRREYAQSSGLNLIVQHNLSAANLLHADKMRGLAVPSLAISNVDYPLDNFGEITLLGGPDLVDPRKDRAAKVFDADVYSPRYPTVRYKIARGPMDKAWKRLGDVSAELGHVLSSEIDNGEVERKGLEAFRDSSAVQLQFLRETGRGIELPQQAARTNYLALAPELGGMTVDTYAVEHDPIVKAAIEKAINLQIEQIRDAAPDLSVEELRSGYYMRDGSLRRSVVDDIRQEIKIARDPGVDRYAARTVIRDAIKPHADEFAAWVEEQFGSIVAGESIVTETASGNWKYLPHTLDNVVKVLRKKLRDGEGFNYGVGSIRSTVANQFKSVSAIQKARGRLIPADAMKALKDEVSDEFVALATKLGAYSDFSGGIGWLDTFSEQLKEMAERGPRSLKQYFNDLPDDLVQEAGAFLDKLADMPTEYFEAKLQRAVDISEFKAAVLPKDAKKEARDVLKRAGVPVFEYDPNVDGSRAAMIRRASGEGQLLFQGPVSTETEAFKRWFGDSKVVDANGKPLVVYHGTAADFDAFSEAADAKHIDLPGFYFTPDAGIAERFAASSSRREFRDADGYIEGYEGAAIVPAYLSIQNPAAINLDDRETGVMSGPADVRSALEAAKSAGHDGAVIRWWADGSGDVQYVAFDPTQIKSVNNRGTFDPNDPRLLFQDGGVVARGSIQFPAAGIGNGDTVVRLFQNADLSTFLHESGHYFLTVMQDLAARGETNAVTDFSAVKDWWRSNADAVAKDAMRVVADVKITADDVIAALDNGTTGDVMKDGAIDVGMQEQWARAFETYLMEGKAPSIELRSAFEKFRAWLISVYRKLAGLNVSPTPELRAVFDRMLATDEEIANAQSEAGGTAPLFPTAEAMGLTPDEYSRFLKLRSQAEDEAKARLLRETMAPIKRQQEKWFKDERAKVREDVEREVNAARYFRAIEWMGNRRWLGEGQPADMPDMRLSKDILVQRYGAGILKTLPRGRQTVYAVDGGLDPDDTAGWFGFDSGDEMIRAMETAPKREEAIDAETDKRMRDLHGDVLNDGSIEAAALDAVHTDKKGQWLAAELKAIHEVAGVGKSPTAKEARATARATMARMRTRDAMNANRFLAAERKAAEEGAHYGAMLAREKIWTDRAHRRIEVQARRVLRGEAAPDTVATAIDAFNEKFETTTATFTVEDRTITTKAGEQRVIPGGERTTTSLGYNDLVAKLVEAKRRQLLNHAFYMEARNINDEVEKAERFVQRLGKKSTRERIAGAGRRDNAQIDYLAAIDEILEQYDFRRMSGRAEERRGALNAYVEAMTAAGRENELAIPDSVLEQTKRVPYKTLPVEELRGVIDTLKNLEHVATRWNKLIDAQQQRELDETVTGIVEAFDANMPKRPPGRVGSRSEDRRAGVRQFLDLVLNASTLLREIDGFKDDGTAYRNIKGPIDAAMNRLIDRKLKAADDLEALYAVYSKDERRRMAVREHLPALGYALSKWERIAVALNTGNASSYQRLTDPRTRGALTEDQVKAVLATLDERDAAFVQSVWDYVGSFRDDIAARERRTTGVEPAWVEATPVEIAGKTLKGGYYPLAYDPRLSSLARDDEAQDISKSLQVGRFGKAQTRNGHLKARAQASGRDVKFDMSVLHQHVNQVIYDLELSEPVANAWRILQDGRIRSAFIDAGRQADFDALETWLKDVGEGELRGGEFAHRAARMLKSNFTAAKLAFNISTVAVQVTGLAQTMVIVGKRDFARGVQASFRPGVLGDIAGKSAFMRSRQTTFNKDIYDFYSDPTTGPVASRWGQIKSDIIGPLAFWAMTKVQFHIVDVPTWLAGYQQGLRKFGGDEAKAIAHADDIVKRAQASGLFSDRSAVERGSVSRKHRQNDIVRLFTALGSYMFAKFNVAYERTAQTRRVFKDEGVSLRSAQEALSWTIDMAFLFTLEAVFTAAIKGRLPDDDDDDEDNDSWVKFLAKETGLAVLGTIPFIRDAASPLQGFDGGGAYGAITKEAAMPLVQAMQGEVDKAFIKSVISATGLATGLPSTQINRAVDAGLRQAEGEDVSPLEYLLGRMKK